LKVLVADETGTSQTTSWLYPTEDLIFFKQQKSLKQFQHWRRALVNAELIKRKNINWLLVGVGTVLKLLLLLW